MPNEDWYLDKTGYLHLFTPKQIAKAAGCQPVLIHKYIHFGVRGVGKLRYQAVDEHGQPLISLDALSEFGLKHTGYARDYALKAVKALKGADPRISSQSGELSQQITDHRGSPNAKKLSPGQRQHSDKTGGAK